MPATDDYLREPKKMHRVFAFSAAILTLAVICMTVADYDDEWRDYQRTFFAMEAAKLEQDAAAIDSEDYRVAVENLDTAVDEAQKSLAAQKTELDALDAKIAEAARKADLAGRKVRNQRALRDVAKANESLGVRDSLPPEQMHHLEEKVLEAQALVDELELALEKEETELDELNEQKRSLTQERDLTAARLKAAEKDLQQKVDARDLIAPSGLSWVKRRMMEWPILDGFNSHLKIDKDGWMPDLQQKLGMTSSDRFDRCRTCHLGIDKVGAGNVPMYPHGDPESKDWHDWVEKNEFPHPYSTHPNPDLYLTATSPHPFKDFGCTICHEGQGSGTSFQHASHGPNDPVQEHEWHEKYGYYDNHYWEYPMLPERHQESHCLKCHHNVVELGTNDKFGATAPKLVRGFELVQTYGCFGCHEIQGFRGTDPIGPDMRLEPQTVAEAQRIAEDPNQIAGKMRKVGPSLRHLASKADAGWVEHWTANPTEFRPTTRMPRFFGLTNQQDHLARDLQPAEIAAVTQFLLSKSEAFEAYSPKAGYEPNAERGKELFSQKGCLACHSHGEFPGIAQDFGPELSRVHEKIPAGEAGFNWLYTWIKEPTKYHARTKMPDLYLDPYTDKGVEIDPAADIAAWLLSKGPREWKPAEISDETLNELVKLYLNKKVLTTSEYDSFMESRDLSRGGKVTQNAIRGDEIELWSDDPSSITDEQWRTMRLNFVGRRTVSRYGCYGCHDIPGFENARPIGTTLQDWGRKERSKLAPEHIEQFFQQPVHHLLVIPVGAEEDAAALLSGITTDRGFSDLAESRKTNDEIAVKPFETEVRQGDFHPVLGDTEILTALKAGEWTTEPLTVEQDGQTATYLVLAERVESMEEEIEHLVKLGQADGFASPEERKQAMAKAYFFKSLTHHGRDGFLWQKLHQPRSYDYKVSDHKGYIDHETGEVKVAGYDERLRMPKFPLTDDEIEAVATFVLGLVADPPMEKYLYRPSGREGDIIEGEKLLAKFNCTGCHMVDMPKFKFQASLDELPGSAAAEPLPENTPAQKPADLNDAIFARQADQRQAILDLLNHVKPPKRITVPGDTDQVPLELSGQVFFYDPESDPEDLEYSFDVWDHLLIERNTLTGRVQYLAGKSPADLLPVSLGTSGSVSAQITQDPASRTLTVKLFRQPPTEDGEEPPEAEPIEAEAVKLTLDLLSGNTDFDLIKNAENEFTLPGDILPQEIADLTKLYGTLSVERPDIRITPSRRVLIPGPAILSQDQGRGGAFTEWLVEQLKEDKTRGDSNMARSMSPPPLFEEGHKVQTPWLYRFLRQPETLRHLTVLRMPKFNMSDEEAQILANYFAARDNTEYPYQDVPPKEPVYLSLMNQTFKKEIQPEGDYLTESWKILNAPLCIGCHSLGGRDYKPSATSDPTKPEVRGPDLRRVEERLQPDWTLLWVYYPKWITPYTAMPQNFVLDKRLYPELFDGDPAMQTQAIRDALMNHARLMESQGVLDWKPKDAPADPAANPAQGAPTNE